MDPVGSTRHSGSHQSAVDGRDRIQPPEFEPLLDSAEAAQLLQIHWKTLQKHAREGRIPAHSVCGLWRFRASELNRWLMATSRCNVCSLERKTI